MDTTTPTTAIPSGMNAPDTVSESTEASPTTSSYFRGFHAAEQRRPVINREDTLPFSQLLWMHTLGLLPLVLMGGGVAWLLSRSAQRGAAASSSSREEFKKLIQNAMTPLKPRAFRVDVKDVAFSDVIGIPEGVQQVREYVQFLQRPTAFTRLGARLPKGCLLTGPPGTGKTLLARALAGEAGVPFFSCNGADFVEVYAGSGPKRVRELFQEARQAAPSVIFVDEVDAVGSRSGGGGGSSIQSEENRTINQLLQEMDGLDPHAGVIVLAATNLEDRIDAALLRPGRFDRRVLVELPDGPARKELFEFFLQRIRFEESLPATAEHLSGLTAGLSPATIARIVNEAALRAAAEGLPSVPGRLLLPAVDAAMWGAARHRSSASLPDGTRRRMAWRLASRVVVCRALHPYLPSVLKVSLLERGEHAGYVHVAGREVRESRTLRMVFSELCERVAGGVGEGMMTGNATTEEEGFTSSSDGCSAEYQDATRIALEALSAYGLLASPSHAAAGVGLLCYEAERLQAGRIHQKTSTAHQAQGEEAAQRLVMMAVKYVREEVLGPRRETQVAVLVENLLEMTELSGDDVDALLGAPQAQHSATSSPLDCHIDTVLSQLQDDAERAVVERALHRMKANGSLASSAVL